jgi:Trk K+ transport system NAD-binding subunit
MLGAIVHQGAVTIPSGDTTLRSGDTAIVFAMTESLDEAERVLGVL